jgi:OmpA-OmpF porin, OOP family
MRIVTSFIAGFILFIAVPALAQEMLSAFKGSQLIGQYSAEFQTEYIATGNTDAGKVIAVEGTLNSRILRKPVGKTGLEVYRSYQNELRTAGFEIIAAREKGKNQVTRTVRDLSKPDKNAFRYRQYTLNNLAVPNTNQGSVGTFTDYYLAAKKREGGADTYLVVMIGRTKDLYIIDTLRLAPMETGTVTLDLDALRAAIAAEGKAAVYDIYFDTGSAALKPESNAALGIIATYLKEQPDQNFYIVGHTDDTGGYDFNMNLSRNRAAAVVSALINTHSISATRLKASGVGPLSPLASNKNEVNRSKNRRVEIVLRLQ